MPFGDTLGFSCLLQNKARQYGAGLYRSELVYK